jgi:rRNA pseudouridine-1189 N-methylase Emg1 (Nep1/Mra1 family)
MMSTNTKPSTSDSCAYLAAELVEVKEIEEVIPEQLLEESSPGKKRSRKARPDTPIVDSAVRHSNRVRASHNGFKTNTARKRIIWVVLQTLQLSPQPP